MVVIGKISTREFFPVTSCSQSLCKLMKAGVRVCLTPPNLMKKCLLIGCLACVVCFSANTRAQNVAKQEQQSKAEAEEQTYFALHNTLEQLDAFLAKKAEVIMTSNAAAVANLYTDDAVFITTAGPVYGKEGVQRQYEAWFNQRHFLNHKIIRDSTTTHILGLDNGKLTVACSGTSFCARGRQAALSHLRLLVGHLRRGRGPLEV